MCLHNTNQISKIQKVQQDAYNIQYPHNYTPKYDGLINFNNHLICRIDILKEKLFILIYLLQEEIKKPIRNSSLAHLLNRERITFEGVSLLL